MDAPPELEASLPFVQIGQWMKKSGINVPEIHQHDLELGFMILSDFGNFHFQDALVTRDRESLYKLATDQIIQFPSSLPNSEKSLPTFTTEWQVKELEIFREWCLPGITQMEYREITSPLVNAINRIPKSFMHRDFHCRNLLLYADQKLGVIDFQGAMYGPVTYDLVSLLRDCYVDNEEEWIDHSVLAFQQSLIARGISDAHVTPGEFIRWFDVTGLQRHLKCVGIFHRLKMRDQKPSYMKDVPRVLAYIKHALKRQSDLGELKNLIEQATILE